EIERERYRGKVANQLIGNLTFVNFFLRPRGPDATTHVRLEGFDFVHNLLHMTGERTYQPIMSGRVAVLFNGEIYNWRELAGTVGSTPFSSDGEAIIPAYLAFGERFPRVLDGEFAIALFDFEKGVAVLAVDAFGTKPLWFAAEQEEGRLAAASYKSALSRLGLPRRAIHMVGPNRVLTIDLGSLAVLRQAAVFEFDLRQFKQTTDGFITAFERAVEKRTPEENSATFCWRRGHPRPRAQQHLTHTRAAQRGFGRSALGPPGSTSGALPWRAPRAKRGGLQCSSRKSAWTSSTIVSMQLFLLLRAPIRDVDAACSPSAHIHPRS
ncbi:unnamed protein product, partial [Prorocentrum cordatum]